MAYRLAIRLAAFGWTGWWNSINQSFVIAGNMVDWTVERMNVKRHRS
jgi:hypothetical protein